MSKKTIILVGSFILVTLVMTLVLVITRSTKETKVNLNEEGYVEIESPEKLKVSIPEDWNPIVASSTLDGLVAGYNGFISNRASFSIRLEPIGDSSLGEYMNNSYSGYVIEEDLDGTFVYSGGSQDLELEEEIYLSGKAIGYENSVFIATCIIDGSFNTSLVNVCGDILESFSTNK